jgi:hypothetical protein
MPDALSVEFDQRLADLLAVLCPDWQDPEFPEPGDSGPDLLTYERRNVRRLRVGTLLSARPEAAVTLGDRVLAAITCDEDVSFNRQLISPMLAVLGRRAVQRHLVSVLETGPEHQKVCAVRAWYWSQVSLVYTSAESLRARLPAAVSRAADDEVADLRAAFRIACLTAFLSCRNPETRDWLARGFLLKDEYYPANLHDAVARARVIAEADPDRFRALLTRQDDGTPRAQTGF